MKSLIERLRAVAESKLTKMDQASCYETEAADRIQELESKLDSQEKAGKMLGESVGDSLKLLRAIQHDLWLRAERRENETVVNISNTVWRRLCEAVGEPE